MNRLLVLACLFLASCRTAPKVIQLQDTSHNLMGEAIKHDIGNRPITSGYSWLFWYVPVLFLVVIWGWRTFIHGKGWNSSRSKKSIQVPKTKKTSTAKKKK